MEKQLTQGADIPEIEIPSIGLGAMRTGASIMAVLLQAEKENDRIEILAELAGRFGITGADIDARQKSETCGECGIADYLHPYDGCGWMGYNAQAQRRRSAKRGGNPNRVAVWASAAATCWVAARSSFRQ